VTDTEQVPAAQIGDTSAQAMEQIAVVTGGSSGIGAALVRALAPRDQNAPPPPRRERAHERRSDPRRSACDDRDLLHGLRRSVADLGRGHLFGVCHPMPSSV